jgi:uncharacterized protein YraI
MFNGRRIFVAAMLFIAVPGVALAARGYATNDVDMHAGPGVGYPVVDTIPAGAHVDIHGCLDGDSWCDVSWDQDRGWVAAAYLNYFYNNRYVYLPDYVGEIDVPLVTFSLGTYWNDYYVGRPWYHRRAHWQRYWHHHRPHFVTNPHRHHYVAGAHNRHVGHNRGPVTRAPIVGQTFHGHRAGPHVAHRGRNAAIGRHFQGRHFTVSRPAPHFAGRRGAMHFAHQSRPHLAVGGGHFAMHRGAPRGISRGALNAHASVRMGGGGHRGGGGGGHRRR